MFPLSCDDPYINTLMLQRVLAEPAWAGRLGPAERRGLSPLCWGHVNPYGTFCLDMTTRLPLEPPSPVAAAAGGSPQLTFLEL